MPGHRTVVLGYPCGRQYCRPTLVLAAERNRWDPTFSALLFSSANANLISREEAFAQHHPRIDGAASSGTAKSRHFLQLCRLRILSVGTVELMMTHAVPFLVRGSAEVQSCGYYTPDWQLRGQR